MRILISRLVLVVALTGCATIAPVSGHISETECQVYAAVFASEHVWSPAVGKGWRALAEPMPALIEEFPPQLEDGVEVYRNPVVWRGTDAPGDLRGCRDVRADHNGVLSLHRVTFHPDGDQAQVSWTSFMLRGSLTLKRTDTKWIVTSQSKYQDWDELGIVRHLTEVGRVDREGRD
jgi:hypothetical protein